MATLKYFLKIDSIVGGSTVRGHAGEIDADSFSWAESQGSSSATGGGGGAGKVMMQDLHVVMKASKASPILMLACATGKHFEFAVLSGETPTKTITQFKITLIDVTLASYRTFDAEGSDGGPTDEVALRFGKIEFEYTEQRPDGSAGTPVRTGFDVKANKPF